MKKLIQQTTISCFSIVPGQRGKGLGQKFLKLILEELEKEGIQKVQAFPVLKSDDPWTGPFKMYENEGFEVVKADDSRPVVQKNLGDLQ